MADPLNYTLVRIDNNIPDRAVLCYDAVNDKIISTGVTSDITGELQASAGSIHVGVQSMASSGEQVTWSNMVSGVTYSPPWHVVDESNPGGSYDRFYGPLTTVVRFPKRETVVVDPVMSVYIPTNILAISFNFTWPEAQPGVVFEWFSAGSSIALWRQVHDVSAGTHDEVWQTPLAYRAGNYVFKMYRLDGQPLKVMGDAVTGNAGYSVRYREFFDKQLATREYVAEEISRNGGVGTGGGGVDTMLKTVYDTNNDGVVDRAATANHITGYTSALASAYYGTNSTGSDGFYRLPSSTDPEGIGKDVGDLIAQVASLSASLDALRVSVDANTAELVSQRADMNTLRDNVVADLQVTANSASKTLIMKLIDATGDVVDTTVVNLNSWF